MTGTPFSWHLSISDLMNGSAVQASSPQEVRQRLIDSMIGSVLSPQKVQFTRVMSSAGRLPKPPRAPSPDASNTALSRSVRNWFHMGSDIRNFLRKSDVHQQPKSSLGAFDKPHVDDVLVF